MKAMILAAGRGKRMQPLTDNIPKPLLKIGEFTLIEHQLFALAKQGFQDVVINVAYLAEKIMNLLGTGQRYGVNITYSHEKNGPLETGGGIFKALPLLGEKPFLVLSADIWTNFPFGQFFENDADRGLAHIVLVDNPDYHREGDFSLCENKVMLNGGVQLTYGNIGVYHPEFFKTCEPGIFPLGPLLRRAIETGSVTGQHFQGIWCNIGTVEILNDVIKAHSVQSNTLLNSNI